MSVINLATPLSDTIGAFLYQQVFCRPAGTADRGIGRVHRLRVRAGAVARPWNCANATRCNAMKEKREQACASRGNRACLLLQAPCRPVGTEIRGSGEGRKSGLVCTGDARSYATRRCGDCGRKCSCRGKFIFRRGRLRNRKDAPPIPDENPSPTRLLLSQISGEFWQVLYAEFSVLFLRATDPAAAAIR